MNILIDMNLSPARTGVLSAAGHHARHWSDVGNPGAADSAILRWAIDKGFVLFTHDLDFTATLAASGASGPSVIQFRAGDVLPAALAPALLAAIDQFESALLRGAIVVVTPSESRARVLPLRSQDPPPV